MECNQPHRSLIYNLMVATIPQQEGDVEGRTDGESDHYPRAKLWLAPRGPRLISPIITADALTRNVERVLTVISKTEGL